MPDSAPHESPDRARDGEALSLDAWLKGNIRKGFLPFAISAAALLSLAAVVILKSPSHVPASESVKAFVKSLAHYPDIYCVAAALLYGFLFRRSLLKAARGPLKPSRLPNHHSGASGDRDAPRSRRVSRTGFEMQLLTILTLVTCWWIYRLIIYAMLR